jgi:hypothetical protein
VHLSAQRLHEPPGGGVATGVGHAQEPIALTRRDHAQRHAEVSRRGLDEDGLRCQGSAPFGRLHHLGGGLQLDRAGEVEPLTLEIERVAHDRPEVEVKILLVEVLGSGDDRHDAFLIGAGALAPLP